MRPLSPLAALLTLLLALPAVARAAWPTTAAVDLPVCVATGNQSQHVTTVGVDSLTKTLELFVAWTDERDLASRGRDIYAQRIDLATGAPKWAVNGIAVCDTATHQTLPVAAYDSKWGYFVFWVDARNTDVYGQRLDQQGNRLWGPNGRRVFDSVGAINDLKVLPMSYTPQPKTPETSFVLAVSHQAYGYDFLALQRVDRDGSTPWGMSGLQMDAQMVHLYAYEPLLADAESTMVVCFQNTSGIRAQKVTLDGVRRWGVTSRTVVDVAGPEGFVLGAATGIGGYLGSSDGHQVFSTTTNVAIGGTNDDAWYTRIGSDGLPTTSLPSPKVVDAPLYQIGFRALGYSLPGPGYVAGGPGATLAWQDYRDNAGWRVYAQALDDTVPRWAHNGVRVCTNESTQELPQLRIGKDLSAVDPDKVSFYGLVWRDSRGGIYAQRLDGDGTLAWDPAGFAVSTAAGASCDELTLDYGNASDLSWAYVVTYRRTVSGTGSDLFVKRFAFDGSFTGRVGAGVAPAVTPARVALSAPSPNPVRGAATLHFTLPVASDVTLDVIDASGRRVRSLARGAFAAGDHAVTLAGDGALAPGLYFVSLRTDAERHTARFAVVR